MNSAIVENLCKFHHSLFANNDDDDDDWTDYNSDKPSVFTKKAIKSLLEFIEDKDIGSQIKEGVYLELCTRIKTLYESCN